MGDKLLPELHRRRKATLLDDPKLYALPVSHRSIPPKHVRVHDSSVPRTSGCDSCCLPVGTTSLSTSRTRRRSCCRW